MTSDKNVELINNVIGLLGTELPVLRTKSKVYQKHTAERIGISRQTFSSIEIGKREIPSTTFLKLIAFFQNNENTRQLLEWIDGLPEGLEQILLSSNKKCDAN